jgi:hypothetical protein
MQPGGPAGRSAQCAAVEFQRTAIAAQSSVLPVARSDGMRPSTALSSVTAAHSCPFAEWIVDRIR